MLIVAFWAPCMRQLASGHGNTPCSTNEGNMRDDPCTRGAGCLRKDTSILGKFLALLRSICDSRRVPLHAPRSFAFAGGMFYSLFDQVLCMLMLGSASHVVKRLSSQTRGIGRKCSVMPSAIWSTRGALAGQRIERVVDIIVRREDYICGKEQADYCAPRS